MDVAATVVEVNFKALMAEVVKEGELMDKDAEVMDGELTDKDAEVMDGELTDKGVEVKEEELMDRGVVEAILGDLMPEELSNEPIIHNRPITMHMGIK